MADIPSDLSSSNSGQPLPPNVHQGILDQTLGDILHTNPQAQNIVMKSMNLSQDQFQKMLSQTDNNKLMNMKVRDLMSSGIVQQAVSMQKEANTDQAQVLPGQMVVTPEQAAQIQEQLQNGQPVQMPQSQTQPSLLQKIKGLLGL